MQTMIMAATGFGLAGDGCGLSSTFFACVFPLTRKEESSLEAGGVGALSPTGARTGISLTSSGSVGGSDGGVGAGLAGATSCIGFGPISQILPRSLSGVPRCIANLNSPLAVYC